MCIYLAVTKHGSCSGSACVSRLGFRKQVFAWCGMMKSVPSLGISDSDAYSI
ncbi:hypothetical protein M6B38_215085 [Iris pallida]|uniref:Uncharacterized protein n=1 Tax=Iris pallida TaxID=29817 RepID=A0AAX6E1U8_IRIPA|nr:hypothetical protein M6B38_215085 [Iris pallida]